MSADMREGGCQCGALRYRLDTAAVATFYACHCTDCQTQSGSSYGLSAKVGSDGFEWLGQEPESWNITRNSKVKQHLFCRRCGTRLAHIIASNPDWLSLKAGTLDTPLPHPPVGNIWTASAPPWSPRVPGRLNYTGQPDSYDDLVAAYGENQ